MRRSLTLSVALGLVTALLVTTTSPTGALADTKSQLREKVREAERKAAGINGQIANSNSRRRSLEGDIASLSGQLANAQARLAQAELALADAQGDLLAIESSLATSLSRMDSIKSQIADRASETYKNGPFHYIELIVSANSIRELILRTVAVRNIFRSDNSRLDSLEDLKRQLEGSRDEASARKTDVEAQRAAIDAERQEIERIRGAVAGKRGQVVLEIAYNKTLLKQVEAERAEYLRQIAALEASSRSITRFLKSRQKGQTYRHRSLTWPTNGSVTSGFGYRRHPIYGDERFHTGIDIGAPSGQAIVAAEAGEVIMVGHKGGYGLMVLIDHGEALATLYAHMSSVNVYEGKRVSRGAKVGGVGCTGLCTGPHVHFETRVFGDPRDPMAYF